MPQLAMERSDDPGVLIPLFPGQLVIGSGPACALRLATGPMVAGRIDVLRIPAVKRRIGVDTPEGIRLIFTPYWEDGAGQCEADAGAATELDVGNTLELAGVTLSIRDMPDAIADPSLRQRIAEALRRLARVVLPTLSTPAGQQTRLRADFRLLRGKGRRRLLRRLGAIVHASEADAARVLFDRGRAAVLVVVPSFVLLCALVLHFTPASADARTLSATFTVVGALLLTMITSSFFCAAAGSLLLGAGTATAGALVAAGLGIDAVILISILSGAAGVHIGRALELYWCPLPSELRFHEGGVLAISAGVYLLFVAAQPELSGRGALAFAGSVIVLWSTVAMPLVHRRVLGYSGDDDGIVGRLLAFVPAHLTADTTTLLETVWMRWRRRLNARCVACALAVVPVLLCLNNLDLNSQLGAARTSASRVPIWTATGEALTPELLRSQTFHALADSQWSTLGLDTLRDMLGAVVPLDANGASRLSAFTLAPTTDIAAVSAAGLRMWVATGKPSAGGSTSTVEVLRAVTLLDAGPRVTRTIALASLLAAPAALLFTFLGVLILWRATGEGMVALLAAGWAFGAGVLVGVFPALPATSSPVPLALQPLHDTLIVAARDSMLALMILTAAVVLGAIGYALAVAVASGLLPGVLVATWLWPDAHQADDIQPALPTPADAPARGLKRKLLQLGFTGAMVAASIVPFRLNAFWALLVAPPMLMVLAYGLRARRGAVQAPSKAWHLLILMMLPYAFLAAGNEALRIDAQGTFNRLAFIPLTLLLVGAVVVLIVRNTWNLAGGRTFATLALALLLPFTFGLFEQYATSRLVIYRILPPAASGIAAVLVFGLLMRPLFRRTEQIAEAAVLRRLRGVVSALPRMIDELLSCATDDERAARVRSILEAPPIGLDSYALYSRWESPDGRFRPMVVRFEGAPLPPLRLSSGLIGDLVRERTFVDVEHAFDEGRFAVTAPELWRLHRSLGRRPASDGGEGPWRCQHLLPLTVGNSVCGLLIVGGGGLDDSTRSEPFARHLADLGVAAV